LVCSRLEQLLQASVANIASTHLLARRSAVQLSRSTAVRPDLTLITTATQKPWLAIEVISPEDHRIDTVLKKDIYEQAKVPRVWIIDIRYDNIEVYHGTQYGLSLKQILAGKEVLTEKLIAEFQVCAADLFRTAAVRI
jgi:Uma2 family endonuclease